jgi:DNA-directed RNA polymerase specialized sigma24 family protein
VSDELWVRFRAVAADERDAWPSLVLALDPVITRLARRQPIGRLRDREDTPREIVTRVLARLHANNHAAIHKLCAMEPPPELLAWLRVVVKRAAIDYLREAPEYQRSEQQWISLSTLSSSAPGGGAVSDSIEKKRNEVLAFMRTAVEASRDADEETASRLARTWRIERLHVRRLAARGPTYLAVLDAVLAGHAYPEIAERLELTRREVELTVRYIEELLAARGFAG